MRPGLVVQHSRLPNRNTGLVRSDIAAILGFVGKDRWPADASAGDFIELYLRRIHDFWNHPDRQLFDEPTQRAVKCFFENGEISATSLASVWSPPKTYDCHPE